VEPATEAIMSDRFTDRAILYSAAKPIVDAAAHVRASGIEASLVELISMRASQINGCAFCLALHQKNLREAGEREDRLAVLPAWREAADWFTERERAALAWAEAVTTLEHRQVPDDVFAQARAEFSERELADLTLAVVVINGFNRFNVAFHHPPVAFTLDRDTVAAD
jgi:AhpD family alkylhydroperoxidase